MNGNSQVKRIALVVNALSGKELLAGKSDSARVYGLLVDPRYGQCDASKAKLVQDCPNREVFNEELLKILESWDRVNQLLLYFSGHGEEFNGLYHLCFGNEKKSRLPFRNIMNDLISAGVNRAILILDSCQSGAALRKGEKSDSQPTLVKKDDVPKGLAIIASCRDNEISYEKEDQTQSVFTGLFCEAITTGLSGAPTQDGKISVNDLVGWINTKLATDPDLASFSQTPIYGIDGAERTVWIAYNNSGSAILQDTGINSDNDNLPGQNQQPIDFDKWLTNRNTFSAEVLKVYRERLRPDVREAMLPDSLDDLSFLARANLLSAGRLYAAGVLLFSEQPEELLPNAYVQCFEYTGINRSAAQDQKEIYGSLIRQLEGAMTFIESRIEKVEVTEQGTLAAKYEYQYPMACVREILANALCHRDYLDKTGHTTVRLFQDRIEIVSPGLWGAKVVEDDKEMEILLLESESSTRNERLATALRRIRLVETGGSGIPNALSDCEERGARTPTVLSKDGKVKVTIYPRSNWSKESFVRRSSYSTYNYDLGRNHSSLGKRFRVAFTFAGEKRDFVAEVAAILAKQFGQDAILYDKFHSAEFSRSDLAFYLPNLYREKADLVVVVFCPDYETKEWCGLEWGAMYSLLKVRRVGEVMLTRFGHVEGTGLRGQAGYTDLDDLTPQQAADEILERLAINEGLPRDHYKALVKGSKRAAIPNNLPRLQYFFGREEELKMIADSLSEDARGWGSVIDGPGGIGKTSLAIRAAELVPAGRFSRIIFLSSKERELTADGQRSLGNFILPSYLEMLNAIARELGKAEITKTTEEERAEAVLRGLRGEDVLLLLDNLETLSEPDRDQLFAFLNRLPRGCSAIVISRRRSDASAVIVRLDKLDWPAASELIAELAKNYDLLRRASEAERRALYENTGGNPLLIRWIAGQLGLGRCRTIAAALEFLRSAPAGNDPLEFIFGDLLDTFTANETKVMAALSYFTSPMAVKFIAELANLNFAATRGALSDLSSRALVLADSEERNFILTRMIADYLRTKRHEIVAETGNRLEKYAYALIVENGYKKHDRFPMLDAAWPTVSPALPLFIAGENKRLQTVCDALTLFLEFTGRWDEWQSLEQQAEAKAVAAGDYLNAGWRAYQTGWVHSLRQQADDVLVYAEWASAHWQIAKAGVRERSFAIQLRGLGHQLKKDYPAAIAAYRESLALYRSLSAESVDVALTLCSLADAEADSGDYAAAERDYREALRIARAVGDAEGEAVYTGNLADMALNRKDWPGAETLARQALPLSEKVGRLEVIALDCRRIAKALVRQGKSAEALPYAKRAVEIFTRLGSPRLEESLATLAECEA